MSFDDEKIADEKSIANMKLKYAGLSETKMVKSLQENSVIKNNLDIAKKIKRIDKYLAYLRDITDGDINSYINELKSINNLELQKLKEVYVELNETDLDIPEMITRPQNIYELNRNLADSELELLEELFELFLKETKEQNKILLEKMIKRKLKAFKIMFLNPKLNI